ncbi:hypothetical protein PINS_up016574 [Pythium insidiosum]|nr:hypothetical protein PINS_up016574 [Pythium insidiosum]
MNACQGDVRVFSIFRERGMYTQPHADYIELQQRALRERLHKKAGSTSSSGNRDTSVQMRLDASIPAVGIRGAEARVTTGAASDAMLHSYRKLLCRRCFVYNCQYHGIGQPRRQARVDPPQPNVRASLRCRLLDNNGISLDEHDDTGDTPSSGRNHTDPVTDAGIDDPQDVDHAPPDNNDHEHFDHDHDDHEEKAPGIRRSVRSLTAASTRASSMLEQQQGPRKHRKRSHGARQRTGVEGEDYFGLGSLYRAITEKRYVHLCGQDEACGLSCYKHLHASSPAGTWKPLEIASIRFISDCVSSKPCVIAFLMGVERCAEIFALQESNSGIDNGNDMLLRELEMMSRSGSDNYHHVTTSVRGNTSEHLLRTRYQRMKDRGANHQYVPCDHTGSSCNSGDCSCMRRDHFCDRACSCPPDCANRFPGCRCERGECRTPACPCFFSNRECDPDVCMSCGACDVPVIVADAARHAHKSNRQLGVCSNTNILRGRYRKVGIASSKTHGWGAFALESIKAGDFIYEYTGELLSQDEAERRGNIYDRNLVSFLFDLNEDVVVDAARKGNKSKFANHSSATPNCFARIILVNGDHRIGLYAKTDIRPGEELFFDYGYHGVVPDWSQARIRSMGHASIVPSAPASVSDDQDDQESIVSIESAEIETAENGEAETQPNLNVVEMEDAPSAEGPSSS